jgi:hypothetical protein
LTTVLTRLILPHVQNPVGRISPNSLNCATSARTISAIPGIKR